MNSYYTAIYFTRDLGIPNFHCTHKYLGKNLSGQDLDEIVRLINLYFKFTGHPHPVEMRFDRLDFFGEGSIVLTESSTKYIPMAALRSELDKFREDEFKPYRPHVTIGANEKLWIKDKLEIPIYLQPVEYRLIEWTGAEAKVLKAWPLK